MSGGNIVPTVVAIKNDAYKLVLKKQTEIYDNTGEKRNIKEIVEQAIIAGIGSVK